MSAAEGPHVHGYLLHVGVAHGLRDALAFIVAGPGANWIHMAPVILTLRMDFRVYEGEKNETMFSSFLYFKFI